MPFIFLRGRIFYPTEKKPPSCVCPIWTVDFLKEKLTLHFLKKCINLTSFEGKKFINYFLWQKLIIFNFTPLRPEKTLLCPTYFFALQNRKFSNKVETFLETLKTCLDIDLKFWKNSKIVIRQTLLFYPVNFM